MTLDRAAILSSLEVLTPQRRLAFAAATCERLLPAYSAFVDEQPSWDADAMRSAVECAWRAVRGERVAPSELAAHRTRCLSAIPDSEDYGTTLAGAVIDIGTAVVRLLDSVSDPSPAGCIAVATAAHDAVDLYVQSLLDMDPNASNYQALVDQHPVMAREVARQREDLDLLRSWRELDALGIALLRASDRTALPGA